MDDIGQASTGLRNVFPLMAGADRRFCGRIYPPQALRLLAGGFFKPSLDEGLAAGLTVESACRSAQMIRCFKRLVHFELLQITPASK